MKNKFMRSVTAMVVAVTMLISSQGVVTSFADGGDHSDMSESSSVQMNEVGNNGTNQPTENGTGEDAAVKDVVEMINALPAAETITEETDLVSLKDQVNVARAAYNALSDDQKATFNADVLGKLTALEAKISELESNDQETKPSDAVQTVVDAINVNQVTLRVSVHGMLPLFTLPLYGTASIRNAIYNAQNSKWWINPGKKLCLFPVYLHHIASNCKHETISPCFLTEKVISLL